MITSWRKNYRDDSRYGIISMQLTLYGTSVERTIDINLYLKKYLTNIWRKKYRDEYILGIISILLNIDGNIV